MYLWEILLLKISVSHCQCWSFPEKHILESTSSKCLILLVHVEIPEVMYNLNIHLHYPVFTKVHVPSLVREFLIYWEDTCENSTVTVKVIDMINNLYCIFLKLWTSLMPECIIISYLYTMQVGKRRAAWIFVNMSIHMFVTHLDTEREMVALEYCELSGDEVFYWGKT
jgi:hypothetical protein